MVYSVRVREWNLFYYFFLENNQQKNIYIKFFNDLERPSLSGDDDRRHWIENFHSILFMKPIVSSDVMMMMRDV